MKKIVITCGLISGAIAATTMAIGMSMCASDPNFEHSMVVGYATMVLAFSLIFVAIKSYRDKQNGGIVSFGRAFSIGLLISLIASTMYVVTWAIMYNYFLPDFMELYSAQMIKTAEKSGDQVMIKKTLDEIKMMKNMYKNPVMFTLMTYAEILPVGLLVSLIAAVILKKKGSNGKLQAA